MNTTKRIKDELRPLMNENQLCTAASRCRIVHENVTLSMGQLSSVSGPMYASTAQAPI